MKKLPERILTDWEKRSGPAVLSTIDSNNVINTVYVSNVALLDDSYFAIADGAFNKTRKNIENGSMASFLFLSPDAAYQIKGHFEYLTQGPEMERAKEWADFTWPVHAIAKVIVEEIYHGANKIL